MDSKVTNQDQPERNILLVDDEENITRSLLRVLRKDNYNIFTASSAEQGLNILKSNDIAVIISDQRMPEMSGTEFLSQVSKLYPDTIRIVLSGYTDLNSVTDAINEGKIYKFLTKPWDDKLLRQNIEDAFYQYELKDENKRLSNELKQANDELKRANMKLSNNVKTEARHAEINLRSLQVAQDVLLNLPIGIIGIDEEDIIAFVNDKAHKILSKDGAGIIGSLASDVLPLNITEYQQSMQVNETNYVSWPSDDRVINLLLHKYQMLNDAIVLIMVMITNENEYNA